MFMVYAFNSFPSQSDLTRRVFMNVHVRVVALCAEEILQQGSFGLSVLFLAVRMVNYTFPLFFFSFLSNAIAGGVPRSQAGLLKDKVCKERGAV